MRIKKIIEIIKKSLSPDLLKPCFREKNINNPTFGHCYVASEVLFHILNNPKKYSPMRGKDKDGTNHWWIIDVDNGNIIDPTVDQYNMLNKIPPYEVGVRCSFLTKSPSKRAKILLSRITEKVKLLKK